MLPSQTMNKERIPAITGIGKAVPPRIVINSDIDQILEKQAGFTSRLMRMAKVGIESRHWVKPGEQATSDLAVEASIQALKMAGISKEQLKTIVVATGTSDFVAVAAAAIVQHKLGLPSNIRAYDVYAACPGWVQAMQNVFADLTSSYGQGGPQLVVGAEVISPILSKNRPDTFAIFADAAGATTVDLVEPDEGAPTKIAFAFGSDGQYADKLNVLAGGSKYPTSAETVAKDMHTVNMDGRLVKEKAITRMTELTKQVLEKAGVPQEEVTLFIPHQANLQIIKETAEALNFPQERVFVTVDHMGNTSAASIPTALYEAYEQGAIKRNDILAVVSFGAGMLYAAAVLPMVGLPKK